MNLLRTLIGPVWVLDAVLSADGSHTLTAWRCRPGHVPEPAACDPAAVAGGVAVVTVRGHGVVTKPLAAETVVARVRAEGGTFLHSEAGDEVSFVRRERVHPVLSELERNEIRPQFVGVALSPEAAAEAFRKALRWRLLLRLTPEGSALARAVVRRGGVPCCWGCSSVFWPRMPYSVPGWRPGGNDCRRNSKFGSAPPRRLLRRECGSGSWRRRFWRVPSPRMPWSAIGLAGPFPGVWC